MEKFKCIVCMHFYVNLLTSYVFTFRVYLRFKILSLIFISSILYYMCPIWEGQLHMYLNKDCITVTVTITCYIDQKEKKVWRFLTIRDLRLGLGLDICMKSWPVNVLLFFYLSMCAQSVNSVDLVVYVDREALVLDLLACMSVFFPVSQQL